VIDASARRQHFKRAAYLHLAIGGRHKLKFDLLVKGSDQWKVFPEASNSNSGWRSLGAMFSLSSAQSLIETHLRKRQSSRSAKTNRFCRWRRHRLSSGRYLLSPLDQLQRREFLYSN